MTNWRDRFFVLTASLALICCAGAGCGGGGSPDSAPPLPTDTTPPQIADITGINDGDTITTAVVFTATATDDTAIASFRLTVGGTKVVDAARTEITYAWDVRRIQPGPYDLVFAAVDAAGNTDTRVLGVTVLNDYLPPPADEPEPEPEPEQKLAVQPVYDFDYVLPPMDPALYNPDDKGIPTLLLVGIKNNDVVYETCQVSATATDDTGVNVITILVDGYQLALEEGYSLHYEWDTTVYADGAHTVTFVVRDNGANVGQCSLEVTIDNTSDHTGPTIDPLTDSNWTYGEFSGPVVDIDSSHGWKCRGAGVIHFRVHATDPQGVASLAMSINGGAPNEVDSGYLEYDLHSDYTKAVDWYKVEIDSADSLGNHTFVRLYVVARNMDTVCGQVIAANGLAIGEANVYLLPGQISSPNEADIATAMVTTRAYCNGQFSLDPVPCGVYTLCAKRGSYETVVPLTLVLGYPEFEESLSGDNAVTLMPKHGTAEPNKRLAIVTGTKDNVPAAFQTMFTTDFRAYARADGDRALPESISLFDGDNSLSDGQPDFMQFVRDPDLLYQYRYVVIESGNAFEAQWLADPDAVAALRGWVEDGGRLILTGQAYDFAEQMFPKYLDFSGSDDLDGLGPEAEALDAAQGCQDEAYVSLTDYCYFTPNHRRELSDMLEPRGLSEIPPVFLPADHPRIMAREDEVLASLRIKLIPPADTPSAPIATMYRTELGRVLVICFPIAQPELSAGNMTALLLDWLMFAR